MSSFFVSSPPVFFFLLLPAKLGSEFRLKTKAGGRHLDPFAQAEVVPSLGAGGISSMKGEHGSNDCWGGAISMLEIASTQGLLDHDTSGAVLIIWTAPSAPLIFYPRQFIWSSVCTHTVHFRKSFLLPPSVARCFCMACSDDSETERQSEG